MVTAGVKKRKGSGVGVLLLAALGILILYAVAANPFYTYLKTQTVEEACGKILEMDLSGLDEEDEEILQGYQLEKLEFIIADQDFQAIYVSKAEETDSQIQKYIRNHLEKFQEEPTVSVRKYRRMKVIRLRTTLVQEGVTYYVSIRKELYGISEMIWYTVLYFGAALLILGGAGAVLEGKWNKKRALKETSGKEGTYLAAGGGSGRMEEEEGQKRLDRVQKEFVANVSHELKTPLAVISGQVEMLQSMGDGIDRDYYFASIREEIDKMSEMVGNLLDLTIMEHHMERMELCQVNLSDMMEYLLLKYDALFQKNKVKLSANVEKGCLVRGNSMYLEQAVNNYIMNAFQHTAQGKKMAVTLRRQDAFARIGVYNQGPQIAEEDMEHIWQSFYMNSQGNYQREEKTSNAGLGLYLVKKIVDQHHGECGVENREDGVEFWILIPIFQV